MLADIAAVQKVADFLIGLLCPVLVLTAWLWGVRRLVKPETARRLYQQPPLDRVMPALVLLLCCGGASALWASRRWISYGILVPVALSALAVAILMLVCPRQPQ